jgi:hypothetical protein
MCFFEGSSNFRRFVVEREQFLRWRKIGFGGVEGGFWGLEWSDGVDRWDWEGMQVRMWVVTWVLRVERRVEVVACRWSRILVRNFRLVEVDWTSDWVWEEAWWSRVVRCEIFEA